MPLHIKYPPLIGYHPHLFWGFVLFLTFGCLMEFAKEIPWHRLRAWKRRRLCFIAWPTLQAMCADPQAAEMWGRSVDRLWIDGGSIRGFRAGVRLGWMEYNVDRTGAPVRVDHERVGHVTDAGRAAWASHPFPRPVGMCECPVPE